MALRFLFELLFDERSGVNFVGFEEKSSCGSLVVDVPIVVAQV